MLYDIIESQRSYRIETDTDIKCEFDKYSSLEIGEEEEKKKKKTEKTTTLFRECTCQKKKQVQPN